MSEYDGLIPNPNYDPNYGKPKVIDAATFTKLTDAILESNGVPRKELFEYPYNEFESRRMIAKAEATTRKIARILKIQIKI